VLFGAAEPVVIAVFALGLEPPRHAV